MAKSFVRKLLEPILIILGILLVSAGSGLFLTQRPSLRTYWESLRSVLVDLSHPFQLVYINPISDVERELFPIILTAFASSAKIVFLALFIAIVVSVLLLILYYSAGKWIRGVMKSSSFLVSSLPDIFVISALQIFVVWFFKQSGILLIDVASVGENQVILFPAVTLSILPAFFFLGLMVSFVGEEENLPYVELARGKGLTKYNLLFVHMIRNILISLTYHAKQIVWMMLSNLLILEYLFNVFGVTSFLFTYNTPSIFAITAILLFIPIYSLLKGLQFVIKQKIGKEMSL
ncbi:ABC transporter permease subunit [Rossellomorea vietnamensis]|uniref:ABC transporter permease subunit n=1 Tax=Rossellomorea vietnamensis TaxID=218284 RepID=A0A5D4P1D0_9BACI|nr:ABC transporter permease subunit [Rossellomorea vietnamensis]TYS18582.1 ABC transporter permease subunit [Rossellomorea vietnamensis]